jgi:hypothetical protein
MPISWEKSAEEKFKQMIGKVPAVMRGVAKAQISKKAEHIVKGDNRQEITEKDMVDAFFEVTPFGFHGPMKTDMEALDIDYTQYGHER